MCSEHLLHKKVLKRIYPGTIRPLSRYNPSAIQVQSVRHPGTIRSLSRYNPSAIQVQFVRYPGTIRPLSHLIRTESQGLIATQGYKRSNQNLISYRYQ